MAETMKEYTDEDRGTLAEDKYTEEGRGTLAEDKYVEENSEIRAKNPSAKEKDRQTTESVHADEKTGRKASIIDSTYETLNERYDHIYSFVMHYNEYIYSTHNYGSEFPLTMIEVHTLSYIDDNPGTTPTDLVRHWDKTKGAISQILTRLVGYGLIVKRKEEGNDKTIHLYVTPEGEAVSKNHKLYDINDITKTMNSLLQKCTMEELETFYKVIAVYDEVIKADFEINGGPGEQQRRRRGRKKKTEQ